MIKFIQYKDRTIIVKNESIFITDKPILKSELQESKQKLNLKNLRVCESVATAKSLIDFDVANTDESTLANTAYHIVINPDSDTEEIQELTDIYLAQDLFDTMKTDPANEYDYIKLVEYDYATGEETLLDEVDFSGMFSESVNESTDNNDDDSIEFSDEYNLTVNLVNLCSAANFAYETFSKTRDFNSIARDVDSMYNIVNTLKTIIANNEG